MEKTGIFIDGAYLTKVLKESFGRPAIDFAKFSAFLADGQPVLRTYYYNCMPYRSQPPTAEESRKYANMQRFVTALENLDRYAVRLGKLARRGFQADGTPNFQQKQVDILLACDLVLLSAKQRIGRAVLITGDSDFIPAIEVAKNEGVEIELVYDTDHLPHTALIRIADVRRKLSQGDIDAVTV